MHHHGVGPAKQPAPVVIVGYAVVRPQDQVHGAAKLRRLRVEQLDGMLAIDGEVDGPRRPRSDGLRPASNDRSIGERDVHRWLLRATTSVRSSNDPRFW